MVRRHAASRGAGKRLVLAGLATLALVAALALPARAGAADGRRGGTPTGQHEAALEAELDARLQHIVELIYGSRLGEARREADAARALAPRDPRVRLMAARLLRESFPDQSSTGESLERFALPIHAELGHAMQLCDSILAHDPTRAAAFLYRGWAHLFAAQMHALCDELWSAGGHAKRGKEDLDRALELDPGNRDGQGILGTYLYFADVLPGAVKLARTVAGIPGGDKTLGREMLRASAAGAGYNRVDAQALLGAIAVGFEGDYAASRRVFEALLVDFPTSPRLAEPLAVLDLFAPEYAQMERTERIASRFATDSEDWYRQLSQRLTLYQSLLELVVGRVDDALTHLEEVRRTGPSQPDWIPNDIVICITEMHLLVGEPAPELHPEHRWLRTPVHQAPASVAGTGRGRVAGPGGHLPRNPGGRSSALRGGLGGCTPPARRPWHCRRPGGALLPRRTGSAGWRRPPGRPALRAPHRGAAARALARLQDPRILAPGRDAGSVRAGGGGGIAGTGHHFQPRPRSPASLPANAAALFRPARDRGRASKGCRGGRGTAAGID